MMRAMNYATNEFHTLRVGRVLALAGVLMTGALVLNNPAWADGGQDGTKSHARIVTRDNGRAKDASDKSASAAALSSSANDAYARAAEAASRLESKRSDTAKGKLADLVRRVMKARDDAAEAKSKAENAAAEAAKYAAEAEDLATRQAAGEDIKSSDIRRAKRKAGKAEQRARAQMKLAQVKADLATRLADKHAALTQSTLDSSGVQKGTSNDGKKVFVAGKSQKGTQGNARDEAIAEYGFDPTIANSGTWGQYDKYSGNVDEMGWTILPVAADAKLIYVSSSGGDDGNDGLSPEKPKKTIVAGKALLRDGYPDWLMMKRGDVFYEAIGGLSRSKDGAIGGRSADEPMVFSAYGEGDRPVLKIGSETGIAPWSTADDASSFIAIVGLYFYAQTRDPESPEFTGIDGGQGVSNKSTGEGLLIEDCRFDFCGIVADPYQRDNPNPRFSDLKVRRNVVYGNYSSGGHAQGIFVNSTDGILLEENIFDHNGWNDLAGAGRTKFNHNAYITGYADSYSSGLIARGNIFARGSSSGLQARPGGIVENNLFIGNATQMNFGYLKGGLPIPGGVEGRVVGNVLMDADPIDPVGEGHGGTDAMWGIKLGNIKRAEVHGNVLVRSGSFEISGKNNEGWAGINNLNVFNNQVSSENYAVQFYNLGFKHTLLDHNLLGGVKDSIRDRDGAEKSIEIRDNNDTVYDLLQDPGHYNAEFGGDDSLEGFLEDARLQSKQNWRWMYVGDFAAGWLRNETKQNLN